MNLNQMTPPAHLLQGFQSPFAEPTYRTGEEQFLELCSNLLDDRHSAWVFNERCNKWTRTMRAPVQFQYDCRQNHLPLVTTRESYAKMAINEQIGYWRGYDSAKQFRDVLGVKTWNKNANLTAAWLANPHRKGEDDIGRAYGVQLRDWTNSDGEKFDQLTALNERMKQHKDDRALMMTYYNPGELNQASLRPCLHTYQYIIVDGQVSVTASQRSVDTALGLVFNMCQVPMLVYKMAHIHGLKAGIANHNLGNVHLYEDQIEPMLEQLKRTPFAEPTIEIDQSVKSMEDLLTWFDARKHVKIHGYQSHPAIEFPFSE